jgi:regulator of sigma E protease
MRVEVISFGYGPRLLRAGRVQLALFPLGGFVRVAGLHPTERLVDSGDRRAFFNRPWPLRVLVLLGWPVGGLLLVMAIAAGTAMIAGIASSVAVDVVSVAPGSPAESVGLRPGDQITAIDAKPVLDINEVTGTVQTSAGRPLRLELLRGGERVTSSLAAREAEPGVYRIGVQLVRRPVRNTATIPVALVEGVRAPYTRARDIVLGFAEFVQDEPREVVGPVGITELAESSPNPARTSDLSVLLGTYLVLYSLVPLPPLPGGQLLLSLFGWRSRRRRSPEAARDLGHAEPAHHRMPPVLFAALVPLVVAAGAGLYASVEADFLTAGIGFAVPVLLLAGALSLRLPRAWAWGVYLPLLHLPHALVSMDSTPGWTGRAGLALVLIVPATLLLPVVRQSFGRECPVCRRLAAAPVRSSRRTSCLACGSTYSRR